MVTRQVCSSSAGNLRGFLLHPLEGFLHGLLRRLLKLLVRAHLKLRGHLARPLDLRCHGSGGVRRDFLDAFHGCVAQMTHLLGSLPYFIANGVLQASGFLSGEGKFRHGILDGGVGCGLHALLDGIVDLRGLLGGLLDLFEQIVAQLRGTVRGVADFRNGPLHLFEPGGDLLVHLRRKMLHHFLR